MRVVVFIVRCSGVLVGLFWVVSGALELSGLLPHSQVMPPVGERAVRSIPLIVAGIVLVWPFRTIRSRVARGAFALVLSVVVAVISYMLIEGIHDCLVGARTWHVVPLAAFFSAVSAGNLWLLFQIASHGGTVISPRRLTTG